MNVLHIGTGNLFGGIERVLVTLAQNASLCVLMKPYFVTCFEGRLTRELEACGALLYHLHEMRGRSAGTILANRRRLRRLQEKLRIDVTVYHSLWSYVLLGIGSRPNEQSVLWFHDAVQSVNILERLARFQRPGKIVSNSEFTASTISKIYGNASSRVIYYPVSLTSRPHDPHAARELRRSLDTDDNDVVIAQVSRLEPYKGHRLHLASLSKLKDLPNWKLWIVGGAQRPKELAYLEELKKTAAELGISGQVRFLGQRNDAEQLLAAADIHCQPNVGPEPFGLTFVEGLAAGLPVVTTRLGAAKEILAGDHGVLVTPDDPEALANALRRLILNKPLRAELGRKGPARVANLCNPQSRLNDLFDFFGEAGKSTAYAAGAPDIA
jgi:glycosyltransferase involved in cell wall biosynthesis